MRIIAHTFRITPMLIAALGLLLAACGPAGEKDPRGGEATKEREDKVQRVEVVNPALRSFTAEVLITGTAMPNQHVMLYALESGYVKTIRKDIGDRVKKGETIAILDNPELYRQREKLQAQYNARKAAYERLRSIRESTPALTPLQMLEEAEAQYLGLQAELRGINDRIGFLQIKAPFAGVVSKRFIDNGALLQSGLTEARPQAVVELQQTDPIRFTLQLPQSDASAIKEGAEVSVRFPELAAEAFNAKVSRMSGALDPASRTMQVEIDIANPDGRISPGMFARALIHINNRKNVFSLPIIARTMHKDEAFVLVVNEGIVERIPLQMGLVGKDHFEVLNPEIKAESQVIVKGKNLIKPGQKVQAVLNNE